MQLTEAWPDALQGLLSIYLSIKPANKPGQPFFIRGPFVTQRWEFGSFCFLFAISPNYGKPGFGKMIENLQTMV